MNPFEFLNDINFIKKDLIKADPKAEDFYNSFLINRGLSYFTDTILYANEMNKHHHLDKKLQNDYLLNTIRKKKRFSKWIKQSTNDDLDLIKEYFGYSNEKAKAALNLLSEDDLNIIRTKFNKGGKE